MKVVLSFFLIFVLLFQVITFGNLQEVEGHRLADKTCEKVKVKAEITKITIENLHNKDAKRAWFSSGLTSEKSGNVEIGYSFWEPDHRNEKDGETRDVIEFKDWYLSKHQQVPFTPNSNEKNKKPFPFPKHTTYLHDTCLHDVDYLVISMAVQDVDDGQTYKDTWVKDKEIIKWTASTVIESAVTAIIDKAIKGPVSSAVSTAKSFVDAVYIKKNDFFGANTELNYIGNQEPRKYYTYQFPVQYKDDKFTKPNKATIEYRVIILEVPEKQTGLSLSSNDQSFAISDNQNSTIMPDWFKNNANWWKEGLISDLDIINALENLIVQDIIPLDNFVKSSSGIEHQAGVAKGGTFVIPSYQKDLFGFWSEGKVSDGEIVNSIGYLMSEGIINSEKIQSEISERKEKLDKTGPSMDAYHLLDEQTVNEIVQHESNILITNNLALEQLLDMQNFITSFLDESTGQAWKQYSENKNTDYMNTAVELEQKLKEIKDESIQTVQTLKESREGNSLFFDAAKENGFDPFVLRTNTEQELPILDPPKIKTFDDLINAEKYLKKFDAFIQNNMDISDSLSGVNDVSPETGESQSSSYSKEFGTSGVEDADSRYHGIDSQDHQTACTESSTCDSSKGEACAKRTGETSGRCIPTWFGIMHAWAPVGLMSDSTKYQDVDSFIKTISDLDIEIIPLELQPLDPKTIGSTGNQPVETISDDDLSNDDFEIKADPLSLTLHNGEYGEILVTTKSLNGWRSPVQITTPIIPSPMTYPPGYPHYVYPTPESETSSTIPVQISGYACTGTYILRVFGYGEHPAPDRVLEVHSVNVEINTIRDPSLELDSLEKSITIVQGDSKTFQLSLKSLDYADYSYIVDVVDSFSPPQGVSIETPPTFVSVPEQTTVNAPVTIITSENTPAPTTFELPIYAETGLDCYNPYREDTSVTVNIVPNLDESSSMVQLIPVTALSIGDQQYPISQFSLWKWEGECDDQWHYHSPTGHVIALDGLTGIPDPDQENCGFGKVSSFPIPSAWMSQSQIDNFKELTGYDPLNSEAMMGGSGP